MVEEDGFETGLLLLGNELSTLSLLEDRPRFNLSTSIDLAFQNSPLLCVSQQSCQWFDSRK
jgi:hypothetical protein